MLTSFPLLSSGHPLDLSPSAFGELHSSADVQNDFAALRSNLVNHGYLYLPNFFPREEVLGVRDEFLHRLARKGALHPDYPEAEAILPAEPIGFTRQDLMEGNTQVQDLVFSPRLMDFYAHLLGGPCTHYDHIWMRMIYPGKGTEPHCDLPYMGRGTHNVMTAWIPYRDTSLELGGLLMLENSHRQSDRIRQYLDIDADEYCENRGEYRHRGSLSNNPVSLREKLGGRWLTTEFRAGDLLTFGMKFVHASLDNQSDSFRISTDTRYQLASEPIDPRWVGESVEEWAAKNRIGTIC